jgi:hypothetical protein
MAKKREPETEVMVEAKAEVERIVEDLRSLKGRVLAVAHGLRSAAATAPVVAMLTTGEKLTTERWLADTLEEDARTELGEVIRLLAVQAREDPRPAIRKWARDDRECEARDEAEAKDQAGVQTVAEANRAAILAAM